MFVDAGIPDPSSVVVTGIRRLEKLAVKCIPE
jgi:hypothetical protein